MVGWNDKEFFEHCPWCGTALEIEEEGDDAPETQPRGRDNEGNGLLGQI
jgi:hypothetical protein